MKGRGGGGSGLKSRYGGSLGNLASSASPNFPPVMGGMTGSFPSPVPVSLNKFSPMDWQSSNLHHYNRSVIKGCPKKRLQM